MKESRKIKIMINKFDCVLIIKILIFKIAKNEYSKHILVVK
jgi:hypothetical protein